MKNTKIEKAVKAIVESCDADNVMTPEMKNTLATQKIGEINDAIKKAKEEGRQEGREEVRKENQGVVAEAEENGFKRGVDAGVDQAKEEIDSQGEKCYTFLVELIRAIDTLQKLMVKIARAESYLEGYNKGKEEAAGAAPAEGGAEGGEGLADGMEGGEEGSDPDAGEDGETDEDRAAVAQAESELAKKFKNGSKLLIEATSKYLDQKIASVLTESVVVDRGELEHLRMVVESVRNNVVLGDERVTDYLTKVDRTRRQELNESRKELDRLRKDNLILESTNKRLAAKNVLMEKTESLPSFERRQMRDAFRGVEDAQVITESFDEKFNEMKRNSVADFRAKVAKRPVEALVTESFDKSVAKDQKKEEPKRIINESVDPAVASVVQTAAATIKQYAHKVK